MYMYDISYQRVLFFRYPLHRGMGVCMLGMVDLGPPWLGGHGGLQIGQAAVGHHGHLHSWPHGEVHGPAADLSTWRPVHTPGPGWL